MHSITADVPEQQHVDGVLLYLGKHGHHIDSIDLKGNEEDPAFLPQLPSMQQLSSLQLKGLTEQLLPKDENLGILRAIAGAPGLKQLRFTEGVSLIGDSGAEALASALSQSASVEHLSISCGIGGLFPTTTLQRLQQLTYLELYGMGSQGSDEASPALQAVQALSRLVDLRLDWMPEGKLTASMVSSTHLTRLHVDSCWKIEPGVLRGKNQLEHLSMPRCDVFGGADGIAQLLTNIQSMKQLTYLDLERGLQATVVQAADDADEDGPDEANPHATASAALTASDKLQHLNLSYCTLPWGAWQHLFPADRQLVHLRSLDIAEVRQAAMIFRDYAPAPEGSRLVSCCPRLQSLKMRRLKCSAELMAPLQGLSCLHTLDTDLRQISLEGVEVMCQLSGLKNLIVGFPNDAENGLLLQLTRLQGLTVLDYTGPFNGTRHGIR